jgi:uroporphyrin-III C-methyltransferase
MGRVFLVGAGPGDPDLLAVKAVRLLASAEIVLHDALVSDEILALVNPAATLIDVGKRRGHKLLTQAEINSLLVAYAAKTNIVIRLKGGDPSIFGRAGEEIEALMEAGIAYEIVPGITSALASAAAAGISLTDRRFAASVLFTTGHRASEAETVQWERLVTGGTTLVIYMPGTDYSEISASLIDAGLQPSTPCTVVSQASRPTQSVLRTYLAALTTHKAVPAPALLIVGECAAPLHLSAELSAAVRESKPKTQEGAIA